MHVWLLSVLRCASVVSSSASAFLWFSLPFVTGWRTAVSVYGVCFARPKYAIVDLRRQRWPDVAGCVACRWTFLNQITAYGRMRAYLTPKWTTDDDAQSFSTNSFYLSVCISVWKTKLIHSISQSIVQKSKRLKCYMSVFISALLYNKLLIRNWYNLIGMCTKVNLGSGWILVIFDLDLWPGELKLMKHSLI